MIKLSDYLNYLNSEVVQARKKADEESIRVAKEYAAHPYLKYFPAPKFTMPSVKLSIPIKISEFNSEVKYNFKMNDDSFINDVNSKIFQVNKEKNLNIKLINRETLTSPKFTKVIKDLEKHDYKFVKDIEENLNQVDVFKQITAVKKEAKLSASSNNTLEWIHYLVPR